MAVFTIKQVNDMINQYYYGEETAAEGEVKTQAWLQKENEHMKAFDSNQDSFRIRLICTVLDTLGKFFQRGERKKIMDRFLMYF